MLVEGHKVIEDPHHRPLGDDGGLLMDRHARRAVEHVDFKDAALFLGN
jgi:hypothetical protein